MDPFWIGLISALAGGGLLTGAAALWNSIKAARKSDVDVLRGIIEELRKRIVELENDNNKLRIRIAELETDNAKLRKRFGVNHDGETSRGLFFDR
jgi:chromosome segregation ATPase